MATERRFAERALPLCFALKWFWPFARTMSFPERVTRIRFVYDLFVFIVMCDANSTNAYE